MLFLTSSLQIKAQKNLVRPIQTLPVSVYDADGFVANATMVYWMGTEDVVFRFYWGPYKKDNSGTRTNDYTYIFSSDGSHVSLNGNKYYEYGRMWLTYFVNKPSWEYQYQVLIIDNQTDGSQHFYFKRSKDRKEFVASKYKYVLSEENSNKFVKFYSDITKKITVARRGDIWGDGMYMVE